MIGSILLLISGFVILIFGANWVVSGSSSFAKRLKISELAIGLTIVAFGTSAPELVVNIIASSNKLSNVVLGNVIGSNIFNLLLILGVSGIIYPIVVQHKTVWREIPYSMLAIIILFLIANNFFIKEPLVISRMDSVLLLVLFSGFLYYIYRNLKDENQNNGDDTKVYSMFISLSLILIGLTGLVVGGKLVVNNSIIIAKYFSLSDRLIGLTIVSIGTSLPELATSVIAAVRKKSDIAIGNVIGSNIFNILLILGISGLINPIEFSNAFNTDITILGISTILIFIAMFTGIRKKLDRWEAMILMLVFVVYLVYIINRN